MKEKKKKRSSTYNDISNQFTPRDLALTEKNYWADNSYYSDLEVTIYGQ